MQPPEGSGKQFLSEASVNSYLGAINGRLNSWASNHALSNKKILEMFDLVEFASLAMRLKETPEYKTWNVTGHGMYGAALNNYQKYLQSTGIMNGTRPTEYGPYREPVEQIESNLGKPFDPKGLDDARARVLREVVQRRGQRQTIAYRGLWWTLRDDRLPGNSFVRGCPYYAVPRPRNKFDHQRTSTSLRPSYAMGSRTACGTHRDRHNLGKP